jgi:FkbM family methyltransferase
VGFATEADDMNPARIVLGQPGGFNELALCRSGPMLYNRNDSYVGASLRKYGEFSAGEAELFRQVVEPGMTVLEIGANLGAHTVDLSRLAGASGVVHAFEPQRLAFQLLCANIALNSCSNVFAHQMAVGVAHGTLAVPLLDPNAANNFGGLSLADGQPGEPVPLVTVDEMALPACHFLKLDVEGMEVEALRGAAETISRLRPILYVENDREARSPELISLLQSYRYRLYWHLPPLYHPDNFAMDAENIFGDVVSINLLCLPVESSWVVNGLREVTGPTDSWKQA